MCVTHVATLLLRTKHNCCCLPALLLLLLLLALLRRHVSVAAAGNGVNVNVDAKISGRHSSSCVCVRDSLCACVCVWELWCAGGRGVTCACVVSSSTFMSLVSLGLRCCFTCSFTVIYHKNILYSHFYKLFCFTPTTTHTLTHIPHTHTRVGRATFL